MKLNYITFHEALQEFPPKFRSRMSLIADRRLRGTAVSLGGWTAVDTDRGWEMAGKQALITSAKPTITHIIRNSVKKKLFYKGYITYDGNKRIEFVANKPEFDADPLLWMENYLMLNANALIDYSYRWRSYIVRAAKLFHNPELITDDTFDIEEPKKKDEVQGVPELEDKKKIATSK